MTACGVPAHQDRFLLLSPSAAAAIFRKFGLKTRQDWRRSTPAAAVVGQPAGSRLRNALEEMGGIYAGFAQFLCWRADLLHSDYLGHLRTVHASPPPAARDKAVDALRALGERGSALAATLDEQPCWNTLSRTAYRGVLDGRPVAVELARPPFAAGEIAAFEEGVTRIDEPGIRQAIAPEVLAEFRQWLDLGRTLEREQSYLNTLNNGPLANHLQHPEVIPEFSGGALLCLSWVEGEPVGPLLAKGSLDVVRKLAEAVLEQLCALSVVDGEFDPDAFVITPSGKIGLRRACRYVAVPPAQAATALKYISGVLASNSPAAAHALSRLAHGRAGSQMEPALLEALSDLEPELKVNLEFPPSAAIFEGNWRALSRVQPARPLYLDLMHRNLIALGYWNAEAAGASAVDATADAQWPVIGLLLRARMRELATREMASEWFIGSGLLFFEGLRQVNRLADEFRENDLSIGVDAQDASESTGPRNRLVRSWIIIGMLLVAFLVALRWAVGAPAEYAGILSAVAAAAGIGLFWSVSRMG